MWYCSYKKDKDGYYRLLAIRYESMDMKEQIFPGLAPRHMPQGSSSGVTLQASSSVVCDLKDGVTDDTAVPMSNLELLGDVAFAMSQPDGTDADAGFTLADGQIPGNHIIYIVPTGDDSTPQGFASVLQPTVEPLPVTDSEYVADNNSTRSMSDITNTSCLYLGPVPDSCDISCSVGPRPVQYNECSAVISANEHYGDNMTTNCMVNELGCFQSNEGRSNVISNIDGFIHSVDSSLESFSLSVLTDAVNS